MFVDAQRIFKRQQHQRCAGMAQVTHGGVDDLIGFVGFFAKILRILTQGTAQAFALTLAVATPFDFAIGIDKTQAGVPVDIAAVPPAVERRQVVGAGSGQCVVRPVENRSEMGVVLFEQQHAHAQYGAGNEFFLQAVGHGAEVFTEDDGLMPVGLKGEQTQQIIHRVIQVRTVGRRRPIGNHPQPLEAHDMVDAQAAGMGEVGTEHFDECTKAIADQTFGRKCGNPPALTGTIEDVGRRANGQRGEQLILKTPGLTATAIGTDREVGDQANTHASTACSGLGAFQAAVDQPLAKGEVADALGVLLGECAEGSATRVVPVLGPFAPVKAFATGGAHFLNGFKAAVVFQRIATGVTETGEVGVQRMVASDKAFIQGLQEFLFGVGGSWPIDQFQVFELRELRRQACAVDGIAQGALAENRAGCGIQGIQKQTTGWRIRAVSPGVGAEHRVHRADRQCIGTALAGNPGQFFQGLSITKTAIAGPTQAIQLHAQTPGAGERVVDCIADTEATFRRHGQREVLIVDVHLLIADRDHARQHGFRIEFQVHPRTVFKVDFARRLGFEKAGQVNADAHVTGQQRRQMAVLLDFLQFKQAGVDFQRRAGGVAEADQNIAQHRRGDFLRPPVGVNPVDGKAGSAGKNFQLRIAHRRSPFRGCKGVAAVRLTSAQYGGSRPSSDSSTAGGF